MKIGDKINTLILSSPASDMNDWPKEKVQSLKDYHAGKHQEHSDWADHYRDELQHNTKTQSKKKFNTLMHNYHQEQMDHHHKMYHLLGKF